ncbi:MAG: ABC transporter substrate-binding protein [Planctomycetes bacterium]|nr:ABC transporter substrate-binding protein [Planctomycetota bacterium]NOG55525.1 ABC transporter substrate-binding protein [Planctomycetota bacterium]
MHTTDRPVLRIGHSPDPDDAFMWFPLTGIEGECGPLIDTGRFAFEAVALDIETLNQKAQQSAELEITAISTAQYPYIADRYALTSCGASMGSGYGPRLVARRDVLGDAVPESAAAVSRWVGGSDGRSIRLAIPGERTSAWLAMRLMMQAEARIAPDAVTAEPVPFDEILPRVADGEFDAGLVIHEGQLTFEQYGLVLLQDMGQWWGAHSGTPLPLGANTIRLDLEAQHGPGTLREVTTTLSSSIAYALEHRDQAIDYALKFGRGLDRALAEQFVSMYVNKHTIDYGEQGREGVRRFLHEAAEAGLCPEAAVTIITPA